MLLPSLSSFVSKSKTPLGVLRVSRCAFETGRSNYFSISSPAAMMAGFGTRLR